MNTNGTTAEGRATAETTAPSKPPLDLVDIEDFARAVLGLAYDTRAIFKRGLDEQSQRHLEAAFVMLDYLVQERLERLLHRIEQAAAVAHRAQRRPEAA